MVDTVLLHTAGSEDRATRLATALSERNAITYPVAAGARQVGFGPQVVVVGVVPDAPQGDEERLLEVVQASPGLRLILAPPNVSPPFIGKAKDCVVLSALADAEGDANLVRAAIADAAAAQDNGKGKKKRKPAPAPAARVKPEPKERPAPKAAPVRETVGRAPKEFDPGAARRARKIGYFFGVALGAALAVTVVLFFFRPHPAPHAPAMLQPPAADAAPPPAQTAPAPIATSTQVPAPVTPAPEISNAPAAAAPAAQAPAQEAAPPPASETPAEDEGLRGHLDQPAQPPPQP